MARFPTRENDVAALANDLINGLTKNSEVFPSPPVPPDELTAALQVYQDAREAAATASGEAKNAYNAKDEALEDLADGLKADLKYAEVTVNDEEGKLKMIGWGSRSTKKTLQAPEQVLNLEVVRSGKGWIFLDWKDPIGGGEVSAYKVQCSRPEEGLWKNVGTAVETELLVNDQERGVDLLYRVIAINKAGQGDPSNSVRVIL